MIPQPPVEAAPQIASVIELAAHSPFQGELQRIEGELGPEPGIGGALGLPVKFAKAALAPDKQPIAAVAAGAVETAVVAPVPAGLHRAPFVATMAQVGDKAGGLLQRQALLQCLPIPSQVAEVAHRLRRAPPLALVDQGVEATRLGLFAATGGQPAHRLSVSLFGPIGVAAPAADIPQLQPEPGVGRRTVQPPFQLSLCRARFTTPGLQQGI